MRMLAVMLIQGGVEAEARYLRGSRHCGYNLTLLEDSMARLG